MKTHVIFDKIGVQSQEDDMLAGFTRFKSTTRAVLVAPMFARSGRRRGGGLKLLLK